MKRCAGGNVGRLILREAMLFKRRTLLIVTSLAVGLSLAVYANPGAAACVMTSHPPAYSVFHQQLLTESRNRIQNMFGTPRSQPIVVCFSDPNAYWPFTLSEYGSATLLAPKLVSWLDPKAKRRMSLPMN